MPINTTKVHENDGPKTVLVVGAGQRGQVSHCQCRESYAEALFLDIFHLRFTTSRPSQDSSGGRLEPFPTKGDCERSQVNLRDGPELTSAESIQQWSLKDGRTPSNSAG
jgi:hypothetical protein